MKIDIRDLKHFLKVRKEERRTAEEKAPRCYLGKRVGDVILVKKQSMVERRTV